LDRRISGASISSHHKKMSFDGRLNIFLIVIDALRPDHLGCYGYKRETSPEIDNIAKEGVMFERVISQSSWTKPSMASLLTSTYPEVHGVTNITDCLSHHDDFLPTILQKVGYITGCIQTNPFLTSPSGFDQGFDHYLELFDSAPGVYKPRVQESIAIVSDWLDQFGNSPFFLYLHLLDTHNPYSPQALYDIFGPAEKDRYDGEILCVDNHIGIIRELLFQKGLGEKTVFIITADHGEEFEEHGSRFHAKHLYEEVLRVPLIISSPDVLPSGLSVTSQARSIDIVPTILELLGLPLTENHQGETLCAFLNTESTSDRLAISQIGSSDSKTTDKLISVNDGKFKLIWNQKDDSKKLYNLESDQGECKNAINQQPKVARDLHSHAEELVSREGGNAFHYKKKSKQEQFDEDLLLRLKGLGYID